MLLNFSWWAILPFSAPGDYASSTSQTITFNPGQTSRPVDVPTVEDSDFEPDETFSGILSNPTPFVNVAVGGRDSAVGTILNDDGTYVMV